MKRQFSLATVFRMTEKSLLRRFFESFAVYQDSYFWEDFHRRNIGELEKVFDEMPSDRRDRAELDLRNIHAMACDKGMEALDEAAGTLNAGQSWNKDSVFGKNLYSRSLAAWLDHRDIFEEAAKYFEVDSRTWWRKRVDLPKITPSMNEEGIEKLESEIELLLKTTQGRGYSCTVEMVSRANGMYYFFAHPDDYVRDSLIHDEDDNLVHRTIRQTFDVGEVRFLGATGSYKQDDKAAEMMFKFAVSPNAQNIKVGDMTIPFKYGWDYLWVRWADLKRGNVTVKVPIEAYVEKVYQGLNFYSLGIG